MIGVLELQTAVSEGRGLRVSAETVGSAGTDLGRRRDERWPLDASPAVDAGPRS